MHDDTSRPEVEAETLNASAARQHWSELLNRVFRRGTPVIIEKSGVPVAAVISIQDYRLFKRWKRSYDEDMKVLEASWRAFEGVPDDELEREIEHAIAQVRAETRERRGTPVGPA